MVILVILVFLAICVFYSEAQREEALAERNYAEIQQTLNEIKELLKG